MNRAAFDFLSDLLRRESGLHIQPEKYYLLESRLHDIMHEQGVSDLPALAELMRSDARNEALHRAVIEAMATHETSFFRDMIPFDRLRTRVLPRMAALYQNRRRLRIWSAACSSGQEPYSIAMLVREYGAPFDAWETEIIATDLSGDIIRRAQQGAYNQFEVQRGVPARLLVKYFTQENDKWRVRAEVRDMVSFRQANLLHPLPVAAGSVDILFCRNVLMYLDAPSRADVLGKLHAALQADGVLFLGAAENTDAAPGLFRPVEGMSGVYTRADARIDFPA